jgi:hypothetical protein
VETPTGLTQHWMGPVAAVPAIFWWSSENVKVLLEPLWVPALCLSCPEVRFYLQVGPACYQPSVFPETLVLAFWVEESTQNTWMGEVE